MSRVISIFILLSVMIVHPVQAQKRPIAKDTCLLELNLPQGAKATIEGQVYGPGAVVTFDSLPPERIGIKQVVVRFVDGQTREKKVLIEGGRSIQLTLQNPALQKTELVSQTIKSSYFAVFSRDGRFIVAGDRWGSIFLRDTRSGLILRRYERYGRAHKHFLQGLILTPDNRRIISGVYLEGVIVRELESGREILKMNPQEVISLALHPKGNLLAVGNFQNISIWDLATGIKLRDLQGGLQSGVNTIAFSPNGHYLAGADDNGQVFLWEVQNWKQLYQFEGIKEPQNQITFSPDSRYLVTSTGKADARAKTNQGEIALWDVTDGSQFRNIRDNITFKEMTISPDGKLIGVSGWIFTKNGKDSQKILILDAKTLSTIKSFSHESMGFSAIILPDNRSIYDGANLWDLKTGQRKSFEQNQSVNINLARFSPRNDQLVLHGLVPGTDFKLFNSKSLELIREFDVSAGEEDYLSYAEYSADGEHLLALYHRLQNRKHKEYFLVDYAAQAGKVLHQLKISGTQVYGLSASIDGSRVLVRSDGKIILWDVREGKLLTTIQDEKENYIQYALSPDGSKILTESRNRSSKDPKSGETHPNVAVLWDADTGQRIRTYQIKNYIPYHFSEMKFSPDGRKLYVSGYENHYGLTKNVGTLAVFDVETGKLIRIMKGHGQGIHSFRFSGNGQFLVSQGTANTSAIWDARDGTLLKVMDTPTQFISTTYNEPPSLSFDGSLLASCHPDGSLRVTDVATGEELIKYIRLEEGKGWLAISPSDHFDGNYAGRKALAIRIGKGLNVVPVERFFQDYYYPGLIPAALGGNQPLATVEIGRSLPPVVKILSPETTTVSTQKLTIKAEATDQGGGISELMLYQNGARVLAPGETRKESNKLIRNFEIALVEGENHFEVKSATKDGSWESAPAEITLTYAQPLAKPSLYLVAIGINKYKTESINLKYASADATAMADLFEKRGPTLYGDKQVHVDRLLNEQATKAGIRKLMKQVADQAQIQDTVVVFIAGHGVTLGQRYFFIPHEFQRSEGDMETDIREQGLAHDELGDMLAEVPSLKRVIIFDTCQSGGALPINRTARDPFAFRGALERLSRAQGHYVIGASAATQQAQEAAQLKHGLLTYTLLAGMKAVKEGPLIGQNVNASDKIVKVRDWFGYAQDKVPLLTKLYFGEEQFIEYTGRGESFPVLPLPE